MSAISEYITQRKGYLPDIYIGKVEVLDINENVVAGGDITDDIIDGSVTVSLQNGARRSASITLINTDGKYLLNPDGLVWLSTKFRISTGILINGVETLFSQGIFVLGEPEELSESSRTTVTVQLYDKFTLLDSTISGELLNSIIVANGTNIIDVVDDIFISANSKQPMINYTNKPLIASASTVALTYTLRVDEGSTYFDVLSKLAQAIGRELYFDVEGFPIFEVPVDYDTEPSIYTIDADTNGETNDRLTVSMRKRIDTTKVKNSIRVVGGDFGTGEIFDATAQDTNPLSPTRVALIGEREKYIPDDVINTTPLAQLRADYELVLATQLAENMSIAFVPLDFLDVGNIITVNNSKLGLSDDRYLVRQITLPILHRGSTQNVDVWRTRSLS